MVRWKESFPAERTRQCTAGSKVSNVLGILTKGDLSLRNDSEGAPEDVEIIHVDRSELSLQRRENVFHRNVEHLRLCAVDVGVELRCVGAKAAEEADEFRPLRASGDDFLGGLLESGESATTAILNHHAKSADVSHPADRWGRKNKDQAFADRRHLRTELRQDLLTR